MADIIDIKDLKVDIGQVIKVKDRIYISLIYNLCRIYSIIPN
jgi:hypothetical protein